MKIDLETRLSFQLKDLCEQHGNKWKEKNPRETAKILRRLGIFYKDKCSTYLSNTLEKKITYIQSAALLSCALGREHVRSNKKQIKKDLQTLCFDLLLSAKAKRHKFDLVNFAEQLKKKIKTWREDVKRQMKTSVFISWQSNKESLQKKLGDIEVMQDEITEKYKEFMREVSQISIKALGDCPCDFALVGLGSMARKEITPYSDFESIIVMQEGVQNDKELYEKMLEYFRWYAVIFQVILINLGETILPSVAIPSLNNYSSENKNWFYDAYTKRGISFDGMMPHASKTPLGRQPTEHKPWEIELIKPVSLMAKFLTQEQDLKNGYHLADILSNTCFVDGSQDTFQMFEENVSGVLKEQQSNTKQEVMKMIKDDMQKHSTKLSIFSIVENDSYNIKQFAYRSTTIFITGIAKLNNIKPGSCFDVVRRMREKELVSEEFSHKLQYAVAVACEIRLKTYLENGYQYDNIEPLLNHSAEDISINLRNAVGEKCCYDYLEIACCLQYDTIAWIGLNNRYMFYHPIAMCIAISSFLQMLQCIIAAKKYIEDHPILQNQPEIVDSETIENVVDNWNEDFCATVNQSVKFVDSNKPSTLRLGEWYSKMQLFNQALISYFPSKTFPQSLTFFYPGTNKQNHINILTEFGEYFFNKGVYFEALYCYKTAQKMIQKDTDVQEPYQQIKCLFGIGMCLSREGDYENASKLFLDALKQYDLLSDRLPILKSFEGNCLKELGMCQLYLNLHANAFQSFEAAIKSYADKQENDTQLENIGFCMLKLGIHLLRANRFEEAFHKFKELRAVYSNCNVFNPLYIANCVFYMGCTLQNLNQIKEASEHLHEAINIYRKDMNDQTRTKVYKAQSFSHVGHCFLVKNDYEPAKKNFLKSLKLWKALCKEYPDDKNHLNNVAVTHRQIGKCLAKYNFYKEAIEHFELALKIFKTFKQTLDCINLNKALGNAYRGMENFQKACSYFQRCFSLIDDETTPIKVKADLNRLLGISMQKLGTGNGKANRLINLALNVYLKLLKYKEENSLSMLRCIGLCYWSLDNNNEARNYLEQFVALSENPNSMLSLIDRLHVATALKIIGISWTNESNWELALEFFQTSLQKFLDLPKSLEYEHQIAYLYNKIGEHWLHKYRENKARSNFENAENLRDSLVLTSKGKYSLSFIYKNLGQVFSQQDPPDFSKAISYFEKSKKMFSDLDHEKYGWEIARLLKNIGTCYKKQKRFSKALKQFKLSAKAYRSLTETSFVLSEIAYVMESVGYCYQQMQQHDQAILNFKESILIYSENQNFFQKKAFVLKNMAFSYANLNFSSKASSCLYDALAIHKSMPVDVQNTNEIEFIKRQIESLRQNK